MSERTNKHDRQNMKHAVEKRHQMSQGDEKFPNKRINEPHAHGGEPKTSNNPADAEQTGIHARDHGRQRQSNG